MLTGKKILLYSTLVIVSVYFLLLGLFEAKGFLVPFVTGMILALVVLPLAQKMEGKRIKRGLSSFLSALLLFLISMAFLALISFQVRSFVDKWPQIKETMEPKVEQAKAFVFQHTRLQVGDLQQSGRNLPFTEETEAQQNSAGQTSQSEGSKDTSSPASGGGKVSQPNSQEQSGSITNQGQQAFGYLMSIASFAGSFLLVFIYIFFMLNYRRRFKNFLLRLFPEEKSPEIQEIIHQSARVTQQYLVGKLILSGVLAVLYSIGLGISGVSNFILISFIAALLNILPYIGNVIGLFLVLSFGYLTSGENGMLVGILITFSIAQFVESYFLEPYVVGKKVDLHPFFVIVVVVMGNSLWGVMGMLLAIPVLAIITIVLLHIPPLHPLGFLFSKNSNSSGRRSE